MFALSRCSLKAATQYYYSWQIAEPYKYRVYMNNIHITYNNKPGINNLQQYVYA